MPCHMRVLPLAARNDGLGQFANCRGDRIDALRSVDHLDSIRLALGFAEKALPQPLLEFLSLNFHPVELATAFVHQLLRTEADDSAAPHLRFFFTDLFDQRANSDGVFTASFVGNAGQFFGSGPAELICLFQFRPTEGDCVTTPARAETLTGQGSVVA